MCACVCERERERERESVVNAFKFVIFLNVFINKKWKNRGCVLRKIEGVSSDHRIITAKMRLSLRKNATRTATTKHYDWALFNNRDIRYKYVVELRNRFEILQEKTEKGTPDDEYMNSINAYLEAQRSLFQQNLELNIESQWKR